MKKLVKVLSQRIMITIIVMLILAGVAISLVVGDSGVITQVEKGKQSQTSAEELEKVQLAVSDAKIATRGKEITKENLQNGLKNEFGEGGYENFTEGTEDSKTIFTFNIKNGTGRTYRVYSDGTIAMTNEEGDLWIGLDGTELGVIIKPDLVDPEPDLVVEDGTEYDDGYYIYKYNNYCMSYNSIKWTYFIYLNGWGVRVKDLSRTSYPPMKSVIGGKPVVDATYTYSNCKKLEEAPILSANLTNLKWAFDSCTALKTPPIIPNNVDSLELTFNNCSSLIKAPEIPNSVTYLRSTFTNCSLLAQAPKIPNSVTNMEGTFKGCTSLAKVPNIPENIFNLQETFYGCTSLEKAPVLPTKLTSMNRAFYGCTSLTESPKIPDKVTSIGSAFMGCTSLEKAPQIPDGVTFMYQTFKGCSMLEDTILIPNSVTSIDDCFTDTVKPITMKYYSTCTAAKNYSVPSNVTKQVIN